MIDTKISASLKEAFAELRIAEQELSRPSEDAVTLSACLGARQSINSMLKMYLLSQSINHSDGKSLTELMDQCKHIDKDFGKIDLSSILCKGMNQDECDGKYCLSTENVNNCVAVANQLKTLVLNKLKINESELE